MLFGFDFDNTLINYNHIFFSQAKKRKLINKNIRKNKNNIKKEIMRKGNVVEWKKLQSVVYSQKINQAKVNKEMIRILQLLEKEKIKFCIISHKTKFPYYGKKINLHKVSNNWLNKNIFNKKNKIKKCPCYFETSLDKKIKRIKSMQVTHFVDDLQKVLDKIPDSIFKILYKEKKLNISSVKNIINKNRKYN